MLICTTYLQGFNNITPSNVHHTHEGRALGIALSHHTLGTLHVVNAYCRSENDENGSRTLTKTLATNIPHHDTQTTIIAGDVNFVENKDDRTNTRAMGHLGAHDSQEAYEFRSHVLLPHKLTRVHQLHYTHL